MLLFFIFRCPNLVLLPVFYAVYAIRFMYKPYKKQTCLIGCTAAGFVCLNVQSRVYRPTTTLPLPSFVPLLCLFCLSYLLYGKNTEAACNGYGSSRLVGFQCCKSVSMRQRSFISNSHQTDCYLCREQGYPMLYPPYIYRVSTVYLP